MKGTKMKKQNEDVWSEIETDECCLCMDCKDHSSVVIILKNGEEVDRLSSCCGAGIWDYEY